MAKKLAIFALASMVLTGCGASPPGLHAQSLQTVQAQDVSPVKKAQRLASGALETYTHLRNDWHSAPTDAQKDQLDEQMLVLLFRALEEIRSAVSTRSQSNDARTIYELTTATLERCEPLRRQRADSQDLTQQRWLANLMEIYLLDALDRVISVQATDRSLKLDLPGDMTSARPTPPTSRTHKRSG